LYGCTCLRSRVGYGRAAMCAAGKSALGCGTSAGKSFVAATSPVRCGCASHIYPEHGCNSLADASIAAILQQSRDLGAGFQMLLKMKIV
jgi:hypothetical protein